ncbi:MAG: GNAT family N-acetyltransferase [Anaerolineales bacterium]|nr:GNAT family N-acetyltransferase [Anaerolineales bacterium]
MPWHMVDLRQQPTLHLQAAEVLVAAFAHISAWPTLDAGRREIAGLLEDEDNLLRGALDPAGRLLGWVGALPTYDYAWELHPLAVLPQQQGRGMGAALVADLEQQLRARGALTVYLGADDEIGQTSLAGQDLFPDVLAQAAGLRNINRHPFEFYQKLGYSVVGVIPDANGPGKPDILMAKRLAPGSP